MSGGRNRGDERASQSRESGPHLWEEISDWLCAQIQDGALRDGEKLPSIRSIARRFGVSISTAQRAFDQLERSGLIRSVPRSGCFAVAPGKRISGYDFSGVDVRVNMAVASMLADAARPDKRMLGSAVLGANLAPESLLRRCMAAVIRDEASLCAFCPPPGNLELRKQIAGQMIRRGVVCGPDDIVITAGDTVAMELALTATGKPQDRVIVEEPTYFGILQAIEHVGMRAVPIRICPREGIDLDILGKALREGSYAAIFLNPSLHNPSGFVMPAPRRKALAAMAARAGVTIIEDDVFYDLIPLASRPPAIKSHDAANVIYCSSFTKTIAPGFRVGWCVPGRQKEAMLAQMFGRNLSVSSLPQAVLAEFLRRGYDEQHLLLLRSHCEEANRQFATLLEMHFPPGLGYRPPAGGFVHWIDMPEAVDMDRFHALVKQAGIVIADGSIFSATGGSARGLRICITRRLDPSLKALIAQVGACAIAAFKHPARDEARAV
jgi:DNA-binding transcriptional MocR family regulator